MKKDDWSFGHFLREKRAIFSAFCGSRHILTWLSGFRENGSSFVWSCWKPNHTSQNTSAHSQKKPHQELVCIPSGLGEEWWWEWGKKEERLDGGKPVLVNDVLYALAAYPQQSEWQRNEKVHLWKMTLRWEMWQQTRKYAWIINYNLSGVHRYTGTWIFLRFDRIFECMVALEGHLAVSLSDSACNVPHKCSQGPTKPTNLIPALKK